MKDEITTLKLDSITVDEDVQIRIGGLNEDKVREYAEVVDQLPPVDVFQEDGTCWLADGFHRFEAHKYAGCTEIWARVHQGGRQAAVEHSILANARHGLPMNRAEKERAVKRMLVFHPDWSNNRLARSIGVDDKTVARYRTELVSTSEIPKLTAREGADGKTRQLPVKAHTRRLSGSQIGKVTAREGADGKVYPVSVKAHTRRWEPGSEMTLTAEETCLHGLNPAHCAICLGEELLPNDGGDRTEERLIPVNGNGKTVYVSVPSVAEEPPPVPRPGRETEKPTQPLPYKHSNPAVGAPTAAGQHCPHCGDGRGRERCNACGRNRWIIAFDSLEDYLQAQKLLDAFFKREDQ